MNNYLLNFISKINVKNIIPTKLSINFQTILNKIAKDRKILLILDIEFQHKKNAHNILELGGIIFLKKDNEFFYYGNFHFNLPPVDKVDKLKIIHSNYITVTNKTLSQIQKLEKNYFFYQTLKSLMSNEKLFKKYYENLINTNKTKTKYIESIPENFKKIVKKIKNEAFTLDKKKIGEKNFNTVWSLYLNDKLVKKRMIYPTNEWIASFRKILQHSCIVVKGNMDIIAIDNFLKLYKFEPVGKFLKLYDIAMYNDAFRIMCENAELEETYNCLIRLDLINSDLKKYFNKIFKSLVVEKFIAHNPLVDAYYTLIVAMSMIVFT